MQMKHLWLNVFKACGVSTRVSNGTGQRNFLGQRDRNFFLVPGQRDNGTSSKFCHGTGRDGILTACPVPSRDTITSCFRTSFSALSRFVPARPVPDFGCPDPSRPLARFLACPVVPLSRDNDGTSVPLSRKVSLSCPDGKASTYQPYTTSKSMDFVAGWAEWAFSFKGLKI